MTTKMPQRPHTHEHHEHGPRPEGAEATNDTNAASKHETEPHAFPVNHRGLKSVSNSNASARDVGQYTGEGQPANMKK